MKKETEDKEETRLTQTVTFRVRLLQKREGRYSTGRRGKKKNQHIYTQQQEGRQVFIDE